MYAQLDLYSVYTRPVVSGWIVIVFMRDLQAQLDLYSVYVRPIDSVGSLLCLFETSRLSWIYIMFIRDV